MRRRVLCLFALVVSACSSDQLGRLDFRTLDAEHFAVAFLDDAGRVISVTRTVALDEAPAVRFDVPDDAFSTAIISWNDVDFAHANRCLTPRTVPVIEAAEPPSMIYPTSGPRVQSLNLPLPDSFTVRRSDVGDETSLPEDLLVVDNAAISSQVRLRAEMDTEDPPLPYEPFVEIREVRFGDINQVRWLNDHELLILASNALSLYEPTTGALVARVDLSGGQTNRIYEDFDLVDTQDELLIVVVGNTPLEQNVPRPTSYIAFVRLRNGEFELVSSPEGQLGGLKSVVMTSSTTFLTVGYPRGLNEGVNLFRGRWNTADLDVVALLANTDDGADAARKIATARDGVYVTTTRQLHYGPWANLESFSLESFGNQAIRLFNIIQVNEVAYGVGNQGRIVRRVGRGLPQVLPTDNFVLPPSVAGCLAPTEGRLAIGREDLFANDWDGERLSLSLGRCAFALVVDPVTECGRVLNTREPVVLEVRDNIQDSFRGLLVEPQGAVLSSAYGRMWFAAPLAPPSS